MKLNNIGLAVSRNSNRNPVFSKRFWRTRNGLQFTNSPSPINKRVRKKNIKMIPSFDRNSKIQPKKSEIIMDISKADSRLLNATDTTTVDIDNSEETRTEYDLDFVPDRSYLDVEEYENSLYENSQKTISNTPFSIQRFYNENSYLNTNLLSSTNLNYSHITSRSKSYGRCILYCLLSVCLAFIFGISLGIFIITNSQKGVDNLNNFVVNNNTLNNLRSHIFNELETNIEQKKSIDLRINHFNSLIGEKIMNLEEKYYTSRPRIDSRRRIPEEKLFSTVSFVGETGLNILQDSRKSNTREYPKSMIDHMKVMLKDNYLKDIGKKSLINDKRITKTVEKENHTEIISNSYEMNPETILFDNIYWGPKVENALPLGYGPQTSENWSDYVKHGEAVKMELGCGRMQNRLLTFKDGLQACVRYRQNTDQIQGEIFSFYVAKLLNLTNLAPSVVSVVDLNEKLWKDVSSDVANAQWNSNRPVVMTQYIPSLESAQIPDSFKTSERHLNKFDVMNITKKDDETIIKNRLLIDKVMRIDTSELLSEGRTKFDSIPVIDTKFDHIDDNIGENVLNKLVELAQWSDLIIFDYLTANLDRIVNNLFNYQWNINIMDGPAHNLARKTDSGLLMFLDNESGLLHGYRLLKKYDMYHSLMLDNLCVFRRGTVIALKKLYEDRNIGSVLNKMFDERNGPVVKDVLPGLPEKNVKILHGRIEKVLQQVDRCKNLFSEK